MRAGTAERPVEGVRKAHVEGEVIGRIRIHQPGRDHVEAFGRLAIALLHLRAEFARPTADGIRLEKIVLTFRRLLPDLELRLFLEDANEDRRFLRHALALDRLDHLVGKGTRRLLADEHASAWKASRKRKRAARSHDRAARAEKHGTAQRNTSESVNVTHHDWLNRYSCHEVTASAENPLFRPS